MVWFGLQTLGCISDLSWLDVFAVPHSLIFYNGYVFEWGVGRGYKEHFDKEPIAPKCKVKWQSVGISELSVNDAITFTRAYGKQNGGYHLVSNNCFTFTKGLCNYLLKSYWFCSWGRFF